MKRSSGGIMGVLAALVGIVFIVLPITFSQQLEGVSQIILMGFGTLLLLIGMIVVIITRLYQKASPYEALIRTGMGGKKIILDGGTIVVPVVHTLTPVSLETMRLDVVRVGKEALITGDYLRADVVSEFYIRVDKSEEAITAAASSMGLKAIDVQKIKDQVFQKLVNGLRTAAATKDLADLNTKRKEFAAEVQEIVKHDLAQNGLTLETVTISSLDQTSLEHMHDDDNVFNAQGKRKIAEIVQKNRVETNKITTEAEQQIKQREVEKDKFVYLQEVDRAKAEATKNADIAKAQSEADKDAAVFAADQERLSGLAQVEKDKSIKLAEVDREKVLAVANKVKEQATQVADIEKAKVTEVALRDKEITVVGKEKEKEVAIRDKEISIAQKESEKADANAKKFAAEAKEEESKQTVITVEKVAEADRQKKITVVATEAEAEKNKIKENMQVDIAAYKINTLAEAEQNAAEKKATAITVEASAKRDAKRAEAEGDQAKEMIPVNVAAAQVDVNKKQVQVDSDAAEVLKKKLEYQTANEKISKDLQIALSNIEKDKEIGIAQAQALGNALANANLTIWGSQNTLDQITKLFTAGQSGAAALDGLVGGLTGQGNDSVAAIMSVLEKAGIKLSGKVAEALKKVSE